MRSGFPGILLQCITAQNIDHLLTMGLRGKQHQMPMRCAVVMRFHYANTVDLQLAIFESSAHFAPLLHQVALAVFGGKIFAVPAVIKA
ncbi:hypothetical protein D3C78_1784150 [compost metagenome]